MATRLDCRNAFFDLFPSILERFSDRRLTVFLLFDKTVHFVDVLSSNTGVITVSTFKSQVSFIKAFFYTCAHKPLKPFTMAKILFTAFLADMRGKVNGTVFSKNRGGAYARTKVTPTNPKTTAQNAVRSVLTGFSQGWRALSAAGRAAWNAATGSFPRTNVFGNPKSLSGHQLYVSLNSQLDAANAAAITLPPVPTGAPAIASATGAAAAGAGTATLTFSPGPVPAATAMIIEMTEQVSPGKSNLNNLYRQVQVVAAAGTSPANVASAYTAKFGSLVAGQKIGFRVRNVNTNTGEVSGGVTGEIIVAV